MLISFTVGNFRSFRDRVTLSLEAESDEDLASTHIVESGGRRLLRSAALYGLNSGGKTNFLRALRAMCLMVIRSNPRRERRFTPPLQPFSFSVPHATAPSFFEITFCLDGTCYRFGFEADRERIFREWLARTEHGKKETTLYARNESVIDVASEFPEGVDVVGRTDTHVLFLSAVSGWNGGLAKSIEEWFATWRTLVELRRRDFVDTTADELEDESLRARVGELARAAGLGFSTLELESPPDAIHDPFAPSVSELERRRRLMDRRILTHHPVFDDEGHQIHNAKLDLEEDESAGTRKFVSMCVRFLPVLDNGGVLVIDELEARMHPGLTRQLLGLFHGSSNRGNAQLIFATHDTHLLQPELLRRDQVWFVDKDDKGSSVLRRASQYEIGPGDDMEREYLLGLFGAVPRRGAIEQTLKGQLP